MTKMGFGYKQWTLIKKWVVTISCFAFVDDTDLIHSVQDPTVPLHQVIAEAQQALATWEGLIRALGGEKLLVLCWCTTDGRQKAVHQKGR